MHKQNIAQRIERVIVNIGVQAVVLCFCALVLSPSIQAMDFSCLNAGSRGAACLITSMHQAKNTGGVNTITLGRGTYRLFEGEQRDLDEGVTGLPSITTMPKMPPLPPNNLTIIGRGPGLTHIRRDDNSLELFRIFHIARGHNLTLDGLSVENGSAQSSGLGGVGGGILNEGTLTLRNVVIEQNSAANAGGGIYNEGGAATIINSILRRNFAFNDGGGIYIPRGTLTIADSVLEENIAGHGQIGQGGGIYTSTGAEVTIANSTLKKNTAVRNGGGIRNQTRLTITNSTFSENDAGFEGGGIYTTLMEGIVTITSSTLSKNHVHGMPSGNGPTTVGGGGISIHGSTVKISNSTLSGNSVFNGGFLDVEAVGGGIRSSSDLGVGSSIPSITITNSTLSGNNADNGGDNIFSGAIFTAGRGPMPSTIGIQNSIVDNDGAHENCRVDVGGSTIDDKGNNIGDTDGTCFAAAPGSLTAMDPMLDPAGLQDNGGLTQTIGLLSGSLAIDRADNTVCGVPPLSNARPLNIDQRGFVRPVDASCDIGAFEVGGMPPMDITSLLQQTIAVSPRQYQDIADCPAGTVRKSIFIKRLTNRRTNPVAVYDLMLKVVNIADGNVIQNADPGPDGLGAILTVPHTGQYSDEILGAGESVELPIVICRTSAGLSGGLPSTNVLGLSLTP